MTVDPSAVLVHLRITGVLLALLVMVNLLVPRRFHWREEMARLSLLNRQILQVHSVFIVLIVALFSALLLTCSDALLEPTRLSRAILVGLTIFWGLRMLMQWFYYSPAVWVGNRFNTVMHCLFSATWVYLTVKDRLACGFARRDRAASGKSLFGSPLRYFCQQQRQKLPGCPADSNTCPGDPSTEHHDNGPDVPTTQPEQHPRQPDIHPQPQRSRVDQGVGCQDREDDHSEETRPHALAII